MIIVRVELHSAITGKMIEIARARICNEGTGTNTRRDYTGVTLRGRDARALDRALALQIISHSGEVRAFPSQQLHVWNLVARMLKAMGYG